MTNPPVRFETTAREAFDDGWNSLADLADLPPLPTTLLKDGASSAMAWNNSPDLGFDRSINPYRGCEHGCVYCYARPTHAYLGHSPGLDFETLLYFKPELPALLERELRKPGYVPRPVALGANTDPYQPVERTLQLTRGVLEVLERFGHPVTIVTKSAGVLRDLDILRRLAARNLVHVCLSVTTLDPNLARRMEPRAATPSRRVAAIAELARAGIPAGVLAAPMIPGINDAELERILATCAARGRHPRRLRAAPPAARDRRHVRGVAPRPLPRPRRARARPGARDARGRALRQPLRPAPDRHRPLCRHAGAALPRRGRAAQPPPRECRHPAARLHAIRGAGRAAAEAAQARAGSAARIALVGHLPRGVP